MLDNMRLVSPMLAFWPSVMAPTAAETKGLQPSTPVALPGALGGSLLALAGALGCRVQGLSGAAQWCSACGSSGLLSSLCVHRHLSSLALCTSQYCAQELRWPLDPAEVHMLEVSNPPKRCWAVRWTSTMAAAAASLARDVSRGSQKVVAAWSKVAVCTPGAGEGARLRQRAPPGRQPAASSLGEDATSGGVREWKLLEVL